MLPIITETHRFKPVSSAILDPWDPPNLEEFFDRDHGVMTGGQWERLNRTILGSSPLSSQSYVGCDVNHWGGSNEDIVALLPGGHLGDHFIEPHNIIGFLMAQPAGQEGLLKTSCHQISVIYVLDKDRKKVAVSFRWNGGLRRWGVGISNFEKELPWLMGTRIIVPGIMKSRQ